ncbi:MAG: tetratricopeptide repeat protein [Coleofasciculus sp. S288]|nr:tetratricopeptide repeat protein [Coleofasciculus sp. S288]
MSHLTLPLLRQKLTDLGNVVVRAWVFIGFNPYRLGVVTIGFLTGTYMSTLFECFLGGKTMNLTYRMLTLVGVAMVMAGLAEAVQAQQWDEGIAIDSNLLMVSQTDTKPMSDVELYNRGVDKLDAGDYQGAIADFTQALQLNPNDADTYYNRGYVHHTLGNYDKAITDYTEAIRLNPDFAQAYSNRGYAYFVSEKYKEAIADCSKAISLNPDNDTAYISRGNARDELGEHQAALADYEQALRINPNNAMAYYNRGLTRNRLNQHQAAVDDYTETIRIQPTFAEAFYNRGITYFHLNKAEEAVKDLKKAAELFQSQERTANYRNAMDAIQIIQQ